MLHEPREAVVERQVGHDEAFEALGERLVSPKHVHEPLRQSPVAQGEEAVRSTAIDAAQVAVDARELVVQAVT